MLTPTTSKLAAERERLTSLTDALTHLHTWHDDARTAALVEEYEEAIEEVEDACDMLMELAAHDAEAHDAGVETTRWLDRAIEEARAVGCAVVRGASILGAELERKAGAACMTRTGKVRMWRVAMDGGEVRLALRDGATVGALTWWGAR